MSEAVRIERTGAQRVLNSKAGYNRARLPRMVAEDNRGDEGRGTV